MTAALRKGWCPGALRPMAAKDGLIVRLRITGGILPAATARTLADLAESFGNGLLDLSARGNLQLRGVRDATLGALQDGLHALGLLDQDIDAETVRNVIASPLAGVHGGFDIRPLTHALERRLIGDASLHRLPGKFGFLIDDGTQPSLAGIAADIRFDWRADPGAFSIGLGGDAAEAIRTRMCGPDDLVAHAADLTTAFLTFRERVPEARRMRDVIALMGRSGTARLFGEVGTEAFQPSAPPVARDLVGWRMVSDARADVLASFRCLGLAAPFGRLKTDMLRAAAELGALRLTPWRVILVPHAAHEIRIPGFITDPSDPRLSVAACVGAAGCARGSTDTQADAAHLAAALAGADRGIAVHVSGCEKGCAKPSPTTVTLVARDGRYDLVRRGRAGDPPRHRGLDLPAAMAALQTVAEPA